MNRMILNLEALSHNLEGVSRMMRRHGARWTVVTKALCGHTDALRALWAMGVRSCGDSRLPNLRVIRRAMPEAESWYLRVPGMSSLDDVVHLADVSLNSELETIHGLNEAAKRQNRRHRVVIMIELGDLREGILPGSLVKFYEEVFHLSNVEVVGIGANLGCLAGVVPTVDQFMQLVLYCELLELKFGHSLPVISAGTTAVLPLVLDGQLPRAINHFRVGEALFLGTNLITGGLLPELRDDVALVEAEVVEIKEKALVCSGETGTLAPFEAASSEQQVTPGQRGYRALVGLGHLDTDIGGLSPVNPNYSIAGASSDLTVVNLGDCAGGVSVGDHIAFRVNYAAFVRLMGCRYVTRVTRPGIEEFVARKGAGPVAMNRAFAEDLPRRIPVSRAFFPATANTRS